MRRPSAIYLGRYQQGVELPLVLQCTDVNGTPNDPTDVPWVTTYLDVGGLTKVDMLQMAADLRGVATGIFRLPLFLNSAYHTAGKYLVVFKWCDSNGVAHHKPASFHLLPGGNADGAVISMYYILRPDAAYLLHQNDSGRLIRGRNPR